MTSKTAMLALAICAVPAIGARRAHADPYLVEHDDTGYDDGQARTWSDPAMMSGVGVGVIIGGGVTGFTDSAVRAATSPVGGMWNLRATYGTHVPLAVEGAYLGSATNIQSRLGNTSATLLGTSFEADVRLNVAPHAAVDPYVFAGLGWQRYSIDDTSFRTSDTGINRSDDELVVPMGAGVAYRRNHIVTDLRGTFRAAESSSLILQHPTSPNSAYAPMHTWQANLAVGYEF